MRLRPMTGVHVALVRLISALGRCIRPVLTATERARTLHATGNSMP